MKRILAGVLIVLISVSAFAGDRGGERRSDPLAEELDSLFKEASDTAISDVTFGDIQEFMTRVSVPMQQAAYVKRSSSASMMMPGKGQFMNGDAVSGALFLTGDLLVKAGTLVGVYFLLPAELQFGQLDYLNASHSEIKAAWTTAAESASLMDALPTIGVLAGGMLLDHAIRFWSAKHAAGLARENIESGKVTFEPITSFFTQGHGKYGIGMGMKF